MSDGFPSTHAVLARHLIQCRRITTTWTASQSHRRPRTRFINFACAALWLACSSAVSAQTFPPIVTEQNIVDAILSDASFAFEELIELDLNGDNAIDVADLSFLRNGGRISLEGNVWMLSVQFGAAGSTQAQASYSYSFALAVVNGEGNVVGLDALDPTRTLLTQDVADPCEIDGARPGELRPEYAPTLSVPVGTVFTISNTATGYALTSSPIAIASSSPLNPLGRSLTKTIVIDLDMSGNFSDALTHGTLEEQVVGFLPTGPLVSTATVRVVPYSPVEFDPLEETPDVCSN